MSTEPIEAGSALAGADRARRTQGAVLLGAFALVYGSVFATLVVQWWQHDEYSYGFLIPVIAFYMLQQRRGDLAAAPLRSDWMAGSALLLVAVLFRLVGTAGGILLLEQLSLVVSLSGLVLLILGREFYRQAWFPLAYLVFMVPFWDLFAERLHAPMQLLSAHLGAFMLRAVGIPVYQDETYLHLPHQVVEVAKACSGANYLISTIAIGIPLAYLFLRGWLRRVLLMIIGVVIALFGNGVRVALISYLFDRRYMQPSDGVTHILQGVIVSWIGFAGLFLGAWILSRGGGARAAPAHVPDAEAGLPAVSWAAVGLGAAWLLVGFGIHALYRPHDVPLAAPLASFPRALGDWREVHVPGLAARPATPEPSRYNPLAESQLADVIADEALDRVYQSPAGERVELRIGYFASQRQGREMVRKERLDWHARARPERIDLGQGGFIEVNRTVHSFRDQKRVVLFWYEQNGRVVRDPYPSKLYSIADTLLYRRSNGAIVAVIPDPPSPGESEAAVAVARSFLRDAYPELARRLNPR